jgi:hypothetical protein
MIKKLKTCSKCGLEAFIWTNRGGKKFCKKCASTGVAINKPTKKIAKPIAPRSQKRSLEEKLYSLRRKVFLQNHPMCEAHVQGVCTGPATECHHKKGRVGNDLLDETNWLALCHNCHEYVENHREFAMEKGFSIKRIT